MANLLNHQHLITKLSTEQLVAVVAEMKWLGLGDLPRLNMFMLFKQLFTSIAFTRLASFLRENLPPAVTFYLVRNMKAHHDLQSAPQITCNRRLEGFFQFGGGMLSFPGNPQLSSQKNRICHSCPIERGLKLLSTSNTG